MDGINLAVKDVYAAFRLRRGSGALGYCHTDYATRMGRYEFELIAVALYWIRDLERGPSGFGLGWKFGTYGGQLDT